MTVSSGERINLAIIAAESRSQADGIRDHTDRLTEELRALPEVGVQLLTRRPGAWVTELHAQDEGDLAVDAVVLQYNPFWHGRRGFAPGLPLAVYRLRRRARPARFALLVHENFIDAKSLKWALMHVWQRLQLLLLQAQCDVQLGTIERWTRSLQRSWPFAPAHQLPVGSNLPDRRTRRDAGRARMGADSDSVVLAAFGMRHPGRLTEHITEAARAVARDGRRVILLNLGTQVPHHDHLGAQLDVHEPGFLDAGDVAELLAAADIFLAPFADGISTRRGSLMAALQQGVAVVGTSGHLTDRVFREAHDAVELVGVEDREAFIEAVRRLAADAERRARVGRAGRQLYETRFDWPVIAQRLLQLLEVDAR